MNEWTHHGLGAALRLERLLSDAELVLVADLAATHHGPRRAHSATVSMREICTHQGEANYVCHAVNESFDLDVNTLVPLLLNGVEVFVRILVNSRLRLALEKLCGGQRGWAGDISLRHVGHWAGDGGTRENSIQEWDSAGEHTPGGHLCQQGHIALQ